MVNPKTLSKAEKERYREAYCGLCKQLRAYGATGRATLSYDMTFIALLLNSVFELEETRGYERCAMRPAPAHRYFVSEATEYAADMNILLAYYKDVDDWNDDGDRRAYVRSGKLGKSLPEIGEKWPAQTKRAAECMERIADIERRNVLNPDEPANCFGMLMGEILDWKNGADAARVGEGDRSLNTRGAEPGGTVIEGAGVAGDRSLSARDAEPGGAVVKGARLRRMGEALGRFLYLLDASNDLRDDIAKERYNPLVAQTDRDFEPLLTMMIGECSNEFELLETKRDLHLLRNVIYSGVWMKHRHKRGAENADGGAGNRGASVQTTADGEIGGRGADYADGGAGGERGAR